MWRFSPYRGTVRGSNMDMIIILIENPLGPTILFLHDAYKEG